MAAVGDSMDSEYLRDGRERLLRVFQFLEALNQHRNPPKRQIREQLWTLWLRDLPDHPAIERARPRIEEGKPETPAASDAREDDDFILKVSRPKLTRPADPPAQIKLWLETGWDDPARELTVRKTRNEQSPEGETVVVRFEDDTDRIAALETWRAKRDLWAASEKPARAAARVFENLYELYGRTEREAERVELVLGDGLLTWRRPEGGVHHPVLLQRLQIAFEPSIPQFRLTETEHPVELYSAMFQSMPDVDGRSIGRCREELEHGNYHPLGDRDTVGFLKRLVVQLSPRGEFIEGAAPEGERDDPRIGRSPVIFLRARTLGFAAAIEAIIEDLRSREDLPWSLLNIVGLEPPIATDQTESKSPSSSSDTPHDVLLSKPANPEQIRIAQYTAAAGGTLVQGPPGTGKTHTIGNLIGHLLAQGKSVLVTSHTTKALRMVRSQVESKLRPLCVSVLESDLDSRKQLESAVGAIAERLSQADSKSLEIEADRFSKQRADLQDRLARLRERLANARADEYRDLVVGGHSWAPSEAARWIAREKDRCAWIPTPVVLGAGLPLSEGEITELYSTNHSIPVDAERELAESLLDAAELPSPAEFESLTRTRTQLSDADRDLQSELWQSVPSNPAPDSVSAIAAKVEAAIDVLAGGDRWKLAAVYAGKNGGPHRDPWDNLVTLIEQVHLEAAKSQEILLRHAPIVDPESSLEEQEKTALEIQAHLREDRSLGFVTLLTHQSWKQLIQTATVNGTRPKLPEHFVAISKLCRVKVLRRNLSARWDRQMASLGASGSRGLGDEIEKTAVQYCAPIRNCLSWSSRTWAPVERELREAGFNWEKFLADQPPSIGADGELRRLQRAVTTMLLPILAARTNALLWERNLAALHGLRERLSVAKKVATDSIVLAQLYDAASDYNPESYRTGYARLLELQSLRNELGRRRQLLTQLEAAAPEWTSAIRGRRGLHASSTPPGDSADAWIWRQLYDELESRASVSIEEIQGSIDRAADDLRTVTIELIDRSAWASQAKRTSLSQRQALIGWLDTIRKIGKGTGIRTPRLRTEAARKMTQCRAAVPVWVMPLARVVDNFDPRASRFDVVIIDEASQSDVMALVALYLGASVVVVGDHEQVSPSAVGQEIAVVQNLIDQFLDGIPNSHLYDGKTSVYDLARQSFGGTIRLVEHFRCVTDIIQFSNALSYGDIKPLRDASKIVLKPHTIAYRVEGSSRDGKVNRQEAEVIASLAAAALEQPEYQRNEFGKSTSFGVVSLVGEEQALEIDRLLRLHIPPDVYERHRFLCGTSAQFQGDERDVAFLSVVDTPTGSPLRFRDDQMFKQRYNVAASRARDQMWVIHSLNVQNDLRSGDLRRRLIEHALDPSALMRSLEDKEKRTESPFEREVLKKLLAAGYQVTPQWKVGARRIDLVVEGNGRRLAVECDGDRYHPLEKLAEDMERQAVLERLGWIFVRIRGSVFFRDPDRAMNPVFEKLRDIEIEPRSESGERPIHAPAGELIERVTRRAEQLRNEWHPKEPVNGSEASQTVPEGPA
jgi:very-short-patch-repair endonuclease